MGFFSDINPVRIISKVGRHFESGAKKIVGHLENGAKKVGDHIENAACHVNDKAFGGDPCHECHQPPHNPVSTNTDNSAAEEAARKEQQAKQQQEELVRKQQEQFQADQKSHVDSLFDAKINEEDSQVNQDQSMPGQTGDFFAEASI